MKLKLRKFNMKDVASDAVVVFVGCRGSGKSFLLKDLFFHMRDIPAGTVISPTENANKFFGEFIPPIFIHDEYKPNIIEGFVKRQKKLLERYNEGEKDIDLRAFLVMDDCLYDDDWKKDKNIRMLFLNGRHWKAFYCLTMQYPLGIKPLLRSNIDYVFILRENIVGNRRRIYENFAGMFPTFEIFCSIMDQCTENFECLVINKRVKSNKIEDQVFWYKAEDHPDFKMCSPEVWDYSNRFYKNKEPDEDEDDGADINEYHSSRRNFNLKVNKI